MGGFAGGRRKGDGRSGAPPGGGGRSGEHPQPTAARLHCAGTRPAACVAGDGIADDVRPRVSPGRAIDYGARPGRSAISSRAHRVSALDGLGIAARERWTDGQGNGAAQENQRANGMKTHSNYFAETGRAFAGMKWRRHLLIDGSMAFLLAIGVGFSGCSRKETAADKPGKSAGGAPVPVLASQAMAKSMPVQIQPVRDVMPYSKVAVRSQITGQLA